MKHHHHASRRLQYVGTSPVLLSPSARTGCPAAAHFLSLVILSSTLVARHLISNPSPRQCISSQLVCMSRRVMPFASVLLDRLVRLLLWISLVLASVGRAFIRMTHTLAANAACTPLLGALRQSH